MEEKILLRRIARCKRRIASYEERYKGRESEHTYHAGWNLGYWEGRLSALEDIRDALYENTE